MNRPRIEEDSQDGKDVSMVPGGMSTSEAQQLQRAFGARLAQEGCGQYAEKTL